MADDFSSINSPALAQMQNALNKAFKSGDEDALPEPTAEQKADLQKVIDEMGPLEALIITAKASWTAGYQFAKRKK